MATTEQIEEIEAALAFWHVKDEVCACMRFAGQRGIKITDVDPSHDRQSPSKKQQSNVGIWIPIDYRRQAVARDRKSLTKELSIEGTS